MLQSKISPYENILSAKVEYECRIRGAQRMAYVLFIYLYKFIFIHIHIFFTCNIVCLTILITVFPGLTLWLVVGPMAVLFIIHEMTRM